MHSTALTVSRDGKRVAIAFRARSGVGFGDGVRVYDTFDGTVVDTLAERDVPAFNQHVVFGAEVSGIRKVFPPEAMTFSPNGRQLAVPSYTSVLVWNLTKVGPDGGPK